MIFLLTGESGSGKTTLLNDLAVIFSENKIICGGFTAPGTWLNGKRSGFVLHDIRNKIDSPLAETGLSGYETQGRFVFNEQTLYDGNRLLQRQYEDPETELIFVDEVGPLELRGNGWASSLNLLSVSSVPQLWVVRPDLLDVVPAHWNFKPRKIFSTQKHDAEFVFLSILESSPLPKP